MDIKQKQDKLKEQGIEATEEEIVQLEKVRSLDFLDEDKDKEKFMKQINKEEKGFIPKEKKIVTPQVRIYKTTEQLKDRIRRTNQVFQARRHSMARMYVKMINDGVVPTEYTTDEIREFYNIGGNDDKSREPDSSSGDREVQA